MPARFIRSVLLLLLGACVSMLSVAPAGAQEDDGADTGAAESVTGTLRAEPEEDDGEDVLVSGAAITVRTAD
ncbi:MAG TPA: hypothetical protein VGE43_06165, partial [Acidimicrobiales bacterium]